ncbi:family 16 glycosylhydrolase [Duganella sp. FT134W]|uniref:Family 16 glycosylhydrolase n=1 Tax=Duganella margarita TaxID=2692170 RepID=A0A7X4KJ24_9BURK|nr:glycoside hydrolase family 16 protein [Duganella margarita]MYM74153.1 family 16 glycosylhydrolase [Duganella margarita]
MRTSLKIRIGLLSVTFAQAMVVTALATTPVFAQVAANYTMNLPVPTAAATATCTLLPATAPTTSLALVQTFVDHFTTFDTSLANGWSPHYDGGYDDVNKKFLGYDWSVKRTLSGNAEQEVYVDPNYAGTAGKALGLNPFSAVKGVLHIIAQKTPPELMKYVGNLPYTSGVLTTRKSLIQRYGYFEINAKLPVGQGLWPAFWLLNVDKAWPPEIDIMEAPSVIVKLGQVNNAVHWKDATGANRASSCKPKTPIDDTFHQYGALWTADRIVYYIDRKPVSQIITPPGVNSYMYMVMNLAVGGTWPGNADATTPIPADMQVEWVTSYMVGNPKTCALTTNGVRQCPAQ